MLQRTGQSSYRDGEQGAWKFHTAHTVCSAHIQTLQKFSSFYGKVNSLQVPLGKAAKTTLSLGTLD